LFATAVVCISSSFIFLSIWFANFGRKSFFTYPVFVWESVIVICECNISTFYAFSGIGSEWWTICWYRHSPAQRLSLKIVVDYIGVDSCMAV
jgi:hypothetical protein